MSNIEENPFYQITYGSSIPVDKRPDALAEAFNIAAAAPAAAQALYAGLLDFMRDQNNEAMQEISAKPPKDDTSEIARMHFVWGTSMAQQYMYEIMDTACRKSGAACLTPEQIQETSEKLEKIRQRNRDFKELAAKPGGMKEFVGCEAARESIVAAAPVTVRKSPLKFK